MRPAPLVLAAVLLVAVHAAAAPDRYDDQVRPFLARHCLACHGTDKPRGDLRLDRLSTDFTDEVVRQHWLTVLKRVEAGEMPPKSKPRPPQQEVRALADWIGAQVAAAEARRGGEGRVILRRLNRV